MRLTGTGQVTATRVPAHPRWSPCCCRTAAAAGNQDHCPDRQPAHPRHRNRPPARPAHRSGPAAHTDRTCLRRRPAPDPHRLPPPPPPRRQQRAHRRRRLGRDRPARHPPGRPRPGTRPPLPLRAGHRLQPSTPPRRPAGSASRSSHQSTASSSSACPPAWPPRWPTTPAACSTAGESATSPALAAARRLGHRHHLARRRPRPHRPRPDPLRAAEPGSTPPVQIASDLGISLGHLRQVLRRNPLPRPRRPVRYTLIPLPQAAARPPGQQPGSIYLDPAWLRREYLTWHRSLDDIAAQIGCPSRP